MSMTPTEIRDLWRSKKLTDTEALNKLSLLGNNRQINNIIDEIIGMPSELKSDDKQLAAEEAWEKARRSE